jgi:hypothetical protein
MKRIHMPAVTRDKTVLDKNHGLGIPDSRVIPKPTIIEPEAPYTNSSSASEYPLQLKGTVRLYTCNLPVDTFVDLSDPNDHQAYAYCWIDSERGNGGHVTYSSPSASGDFHLRINLRQSDPDLLKLQVCMWLRDKSTNNFRTVTVSLSAADLTKLLNGEEQQVVMYDQFIPGNFCDVMLRAVNASDYANFHGADKNKNSLSQKPLIRLSPSALRSIPELNQEFKQLSEAFCKSLASQNIQIPAGGEPFRIGVTRSPPIPTPLLFLSLMLGTPAHVLFFPPVQPGVRGHKGSSNKKGADTTSPGPLFDLPRPTRMPAAVPSSSRSGVPCPPQNIPLGSDNGCSVKTRRCSLWSIIQSNVSYHM